MSEKSVWKRRTPARIYDYNYKLGEGYYKPQTKFLDQHAHERQKFSPPKHQTYAERFASDPWYGGAYGLPYDSKYSVYSEPPINSSIAPKSSSLIRELKEFEKDDIPLHIRASRRKKRLEDEETAKGVRPKFGRQLSLSDSLPFKSANTRMEELDQDLKRIGEELKSKPRRASFSYDLSTKLSTVGVPTRSVKHEVERYSGPGGASGQRTFHSEVSKFHSSTLSKPPLAPRARKISYGEDASSYGVRARKREGAIISGGGRPRSASISGEESFFQPGRAQKIRDDKRVKESEDFSQSVRNMIGKMRQGNLDPEDAYRYTRNNVLSDYDPPTRRGSQKRPHGYSISKYQ